VTACFFLFAATVARARFVEMESGGNRSMEASAAMELSLFVVRCRLIPRAQPTY